MYEIGVQELTNPLLLLSSCAGAQLSKAGLFSSAAAADSQLLSGATLGKLTPQEAEAAAEAMMLLMLDDRKQANSGEEGRFGFHKCRSQCLQNRFLVLGLRQHISLGSYR